MEETTFEPTRESRIRRLNFRNEFKFLPGNEVNFLLRNKKVISKFVPLIVLLLGLLVGFTVGRMTAPDSTAVSQNSSTPDLSAPKASQTINRDFDFPFKDGKGNDIGKLKYTVTSADLTDQIVVNGQKATAVAGKTFLVVNLKITNDNKQNIQMNTRDYIRLSVNGNDSELLAPDIHNDPVEVDAISTKLTRVGFPIDTTDKNIKLIVGEINGTKATIALNLKNK